MEKQPGETEASILVCWNPEIGQPNPKVIDGISRFIGNHYLLVDPVSGHTNVITMDRFHDAGGAVGTNQQVDEAILQKIEDESINPDMN